MRKRTCRTCDNWDKDNPYKKAGSDEVNPDMCACRRYAPGRSVFQLESGVIQTSHVWTYGGEWCGEWKETEEEISKTMRLMLESQKKRDVFR